MWPSLVKFGPVVSEEKIFVKVNAGRRTTTNDGRQVMRKAHLTFQVRSSELKTAKFPSDYQFRGSNPTTGYLIHLKISGQIDLHLINNFTPMSDLL